MQICMHAVQGSNGLLIVVEPERDGHWRRRRWEASRASTATTVSRLEYSFVYFVGLVRYRNLLILTTAVPIRLSAGLSNQVARNSECSTCPRPKETACAHSKGAQTGSSNATGGPTPPKGNSLIIYPSTFIRAYLSVPLHTSPASLSLLGRLAHFRVVQPAARQGLRSYRYL